MLLNAIRTNVVVWQIGNLFGLYTRLLVTEVV